MHHGTSALHFQLRHIDADGRSSGTQLQAYSHRQQQHCRAPCGNLTAGPLETRALLCLAPGGLRPFRGPGRGLRAKPRPLQFPHDILLALRNPACACTQWRVEINGPSGFSDKATGARPVSGRGVAPSGLALAGGLCDLALAIDIGLAVQQRHGQAMFVLRHRRWRTTNAGTMYQAG